MRKEIKLVPGVAYNMQIAATNGTEVSAWSPIISIPAQIKSDPPNPVANLNLGYYGSQFVASWDASIDSDLDYYKYYFLKGPGYSTPSITRRTISPKIVLTDVENRSLWNDGVLNNDLKIVVSVVDKSGNESSLVTSSAANNTGPIPPGSAPSAIAGVDSILLYWTAPTGAGNIIDIVKYNIYVSTKTSSLGDFILTDSTSSLSYNYSTTYYGKTHYFYIKSVDKFGNESSSGSSTVTVLGGPLIPSVVNGLITQIYSYNRSATGGTVAFTTVTPHGLTGGDKIYIYGSYGGTGATGVDTKFGTPATILSSPLPTSTGFSAVNSLTGNIINVSSSSAAVTGVTGNGSVVTYTSNLNPGVGKTVTISKVVPNQYNIKSATITASTASTFSINSAFTGTYVSGGTASIDIPAYLYPSDNAVRIKGDGIIVGNMSTGFIVGISPTSFNMQSSSSSTRLALTSNEIAMYKNGTQSVSIKSDGSFLMQSVAGGTGGQKIRIDPTGLKLYDSSGTQTAYLDSETGDVDIRGSFSNGFIGARVEIDKTDKNRIAMYSNSMFRSTFTVSQTTLYNSVTGATIFIDNAFLIEPVTGGTASIETSEGTQRFSYASKASGPDRLIGCFLIDVIPGTAATASTGAGITTDIPATIDITDTSWWNGKLDIKSGAPGRVGGTLGPAFITMLPEVPDIPAQILMSPIKVNNTYAVAVGGIGTTTSGSALVVSHGLDYTPSTVVTSVRSSAFSAIRHNHVYSSLTGSSNFVIYGTTTSATGLTSSAALTFNWMVV